MTTLHTPERDFDRDRWQRPLIIPAGGGKPVAYRRCTSYVDVIADKYTLQQWEKRQVAAGLAQRDDLRLNVLAHLDDKKVLDRACQDAKEYALAGAKATKGTAFHALTDIVDRGGDLPAGLPDNVLRTLDAFREATRDLKVVHIESKVCLDTHLVAGTPDRVYAYKGERFIGDTKTGNTQYGVQKIASQLAIYSRSYLYDVATGARDTHGASTNRGIVMDVDLDAYTVDLLWIDLEAGWQTVMVAQQVWAQRGLDKRNLLVEPFGPTERPSLHLEKRDQAKTESREDHERAGVLRQIAACDDPAIIRSLWSTYSSIWTDELTEAAKARIASLPASA
ncbi:hypothetical protein [Nocardioides sp. REDSEA-S30_B4]|jgi:hypothetical protein|uniref:hypothetical protein n=1 Tax=Nocardioides sp. REDSEA-S30_B4 TaxID=1811552 RepID=UPI000ADB58A8|nr:hypothetical protein [Nocardioides sp. REDSEA-S30_B4]